MRSKLLLIVAAVVTSLTVTTGAQANTVDAPTPEDYAAVAKINLEEGRPALSPELQAEADAVTRLQAYVTVTNGRVTLNRTKALASGISPTVVSDFQKGLDVGNTTAAACAGRNAYYKRMGGLVHEVWMSSCATKQVSSVMKGGAGLATIAAAILSATGLGIPWAVVVAIAGGLATIGAAALDYCNRYNRGSIVKNVGTPCQNQPA